MTKLLESPRIRSKGCGISVAKRQNLRFGRVSKCAPKAMGTEASFGAHLRKGHRLKADTLLADSGFALPMNLFKQKSLLRVEFIQVCKELWLVALSAQWLFGVLRSFSLLGVQPHQAEAKSRLRFCSRLRYYVS